MVDGLRREWSRSTAERSAVESASSISLLAVIMCRADALLPVALAEQLDLNKGCSVGLLGRVVLAGRREVFAMACMV